MEDLTDIVRRMARREARAHFQVATYDTKVLIRLQIVSCPWCGTGPGEASRRPWLLPLRGEEPGYDWATADEGHPTVTTLGCERLAARSLLPVAIAVRRFGKLREATFSTRAATWARTWSPDHDLVEVITALDKAESWAYMLHGDVREDLAQLLIEQRGDDPAGCTLPIATRPVLPRTHAWDTDPDWSAHRRSMTQHFLTPHRTDDRTSRLNAVYLATRQEAALGHLNGAR